jgi:diacylglycerol kinase family enzyme
MLRMPDGNTTVIIQGKRRFRLEEITSEEPWPVQADGDNVGSLPVKISISDKRLKLH